MSAIQLFANHQGMSLAAAQAAALPVGPFDPTRPLKYWFDPNGGEMYNVFQEDAPGYVGTMMVPSAQSSTLNIPGSFVYPAYAPAPCIVTMLGPYGPTSTGDLSNSVCLQAYAQAILDEIAFLYPGKTLKLQQGMTGIFQYLYPDMRRQWDIVDQDGAIVISNVQALIALQNSGGMNAPGAWATTLSGGLPVWIVTPQVINPPAGAVILPVPIRALLPGEAIVPVTNNPFQAGSFEVVNGAIQIAAVKAAIAQETALLAQLEAQFPGAA